MTKIIDTFNISFTIINLYDFKMTFSLEIDTKLVLFII